MYVRVCLRDHVQSFLDVVQRIYARLPESLTLMFAESMEDLTPTETTKSTGGGTTSDGGTTSGGGTTASMTATRSRVQVDEAEMLDEAPEEEKEELESGSLENMAKQTGSMRSGLDSFKVLTECPLIVMLLFQVI